MDNITMVLNSQWLREWLIAHPGSMFQVSTPLSRTMNAVRPVKEGAQLSIYLVDLTLTPRQDDRPLAHRASERVSMMTSGGILLVNCNRVIPVNPREFEGYAVSGVSLDAALERCPETHVPHEFREQAYGNLSDAYTAAIRMAMSDLR